MGKRKEGVNVRNISQDTNCEITDMVEAPRSYTVKNDFLVK